MQYDPTNLTPAECELIDWQYDQIGSDFKRPLWAAICAADKGNRDRLALGFPEQVEAYRRYTGERDYWNDVITRAGILPETT